MGRQAIVIISAFLFFYGCATSPVKEAAVPKGMPAKKTELSQEQQEHKSIELFHELLNISSSAKSRQEAVPLLEAKYLEIISEYPDAPLAQESYYRLISLFLNDHTPPEFASAEANYVDYVFRYPGSKFKFLVDLEFSRSYYRHQKWEELLALTKPAYAAYLKKGSFSNPTLIYMFAESSNNLGNKSDAEEAYKAVIRLFPDFPEGILSKPRLKEITRQK